MYILFSLSFYIYYTIYFIKSKILITVKIWPGTFHPLSVQIILYRYILSHYQASLLPIVWSCAWKGLPDSLEVYLYVILIRSAYVPYHSFSVIYVLYNVHIFLHPLLYTFSFPFPLRLSPFPFSYLFIYLSPFPFLSFSFPLIYTYIICYFSLFPFPFHDIYISPILISICTNICTNICT